MTKIRAAQIRSILMRDFMLSLLFELLNILIVIHVTKVFMSSLDHDAPKAGQLTERKLERLKYGQF